MAALSGTRALSGVVNSDDVSLTGTAAGAFDVDDAYTLEAIEAMDERTRDRCLLAADAPLATLPRLDLDADAALALRQGRTPRASAPPPGRFRAYADGDFVGVVESAAGSLRAIRLARTDE